MSATKLARFVLVFLVVLLFIDTEAMARRGFGFSRSFGSRSFGSRSFGSASGRSASNRSTWGSKSGGYQRKGGWVGSRRSSRGSRFSGASRPRTNRRGHRVLPKSSASRSSRQTRAGNYRSRHNRPTTIINNNYMGGMGWGGLGYGMFSVGIWDLFFLSTVSHMFWYHHWHEPGIQKSLYKDNLLQKEELQKLEARVKELEAQGVKRDPNYLPADVDPDVAYSKDYVEKNPDEFYSQDADSGGDGSGTARESGGGFWTLLGFGIVGIAFYSIFIRRF